MLILGSSVPETLPGTPGHIRAYDVNTGALRWTFHTIPQPGEFAYDSWPPAAYKLIGGANAWAGDTLFANCVLALDARTGKRLWHFQGIRHDVWDWDFPASPNLVTVKRNGRSIEAVAQITKFGY